MYGIIDCATAMYPVEGFPSRLERKTRRCSTNNDGCIVARSNEAKKTRLKAGLPYFKLQEQFADQKIAVFSSNYELYGIDRSCG